MQMSRDILKGLLDELAEWMEFEEKRLNLKEVVGRLGHEDLAYYI